jgi:hypothetical protein
MLIMREEIGAPSHQLSGTEFYFSVLLERLTKIETNCKDPGYDFYQLLERNRGICKQEMSAI